MNKAYLLTGGNTGNRQAYLLQAIELINQFCGQVLKQSSLFETGAWGNTNQASFLNQALLIATSLKPDELMVKLLFIEETMGRVRFEKFGPRIIDIDILLYNEEVFYSPLVSIPHAELANRRFALIPLIEIAPRAKHPVLKKSIQQLLKECSDELSVRKIS
ncbi:MAG: 2-amino-4-hydroxy-6-hydroxymethyldihydropteridine diphosphokinase [Chitinophagaceae bacterium]